MIRLVVFDWDGTLMDSEARIVTAMQQAFLAEGANVPSRSHVRDIIGLDLAHAAALLGPDLEPARIEAIACDYRQRYARLHAIPTPLFDDARATLRQLVETGFVLAIATGKSRRGLDGAIQESGIAEFFTTSRCGEEAAPKPDPTMLRDILFELDISPHETLMVGDTEYDLMMAAAARTYAGAATYGAHSRQRLLSLKPAIVIDTLTELPAAISRLNLIK